MKKILPMLLLTLTMGAKASNLMSLETFNLDTSNESLLDMELENALMSTKEASGDFKVDEERIKNEAPVVIVINRVNKGLAPDAQLAKVYHYGELVRTIKVSTGAVGYATPTGYFRPAYSNHMRIYDSYYSGTYDASPMRWAVFFNGGVALHSTTPNAYKNLGSRASHGCVRFHEDDAKWINELIRTTGSQNTKLVKWRHEKFAGTQFQDRYNTHFSGSEISVAPINKITGNIDRSKGIKSVDTIIVVKDEIK